MTARSFRWFWQLMAILVFAQAPVAYAQTAYRFSESSVNMDLSDWHGLDERQVFFRALTHQEEGRSWTIKVGKGGQLYSIKTPELGELIALQRADHGQWVDEVFQHVIPMGPQQAQSRWNTVVDGDIHQAGYYSRSDLDRDKQVLPRSVYSPLFGYRFDQAANTVRFVTWPQHAHLPRRYAENLVFMDQTIKDLGGGVVEISVEFDKWGGARSDRFSLPWAAFRSRTLPVQIISNRDGSYRVENRLFRDKEDITKIRNAGTGGWLALVASNSRSARGIGIVYGKDPREIDGNRGVVRWGDYGNPKKPELDGTVVAINREASLDAGETLVYRYYLLFGTLAEIQAKANVLESKVVLKKVTTSVAEAALKPICRGTQGEPIRPCEKHETPVFQSYRDLVPGSRPLFLLEKAGTGEHLVTDNPYEISFDPTDGATRYVDLLGWALPENLAAGSCRQPLADAIAATAPGSRLGRNTSGLQVAGTPTVGCAAAAPTTPKVPATERPAVGKKQVRSSPRNSTVEKQRAKRKGG